MKLDDEVDTKTLRGMIVEKIITIVCYVLCALILWALSTSYKLDTQIASEATDRKIALTNLNNETVQREADIMKQVNALSESLKEAVAKIKELEKHKLKAASNTQPELLTFPPLPVPIQQQQQLQQPLQQAPTLDVRQSPIDYERMHRKEFKK